jgi:signal transduction histidine kinase
MMAIVQFGLLLGIIHYSKARSEITPNRFWILSLTSNVIALILFSVGILFLGDISKPSFSFTIANTLFFSAGLLQSLYCISLNRPISSKHKWVCGFSITVFFLGFEYIRQKYGFEARTIITVSVACAMYFLQIIEVRKYRKQNYSKQLGYLQYVTFIELIFATSRIAILISSSFAMKHLEQLPQMLIVATLGQIVMNTLGYIAIGSFWSEKIAFINAKSLVEQQAAKEKIEEISNLLKEKERLIYGLLKANKTAATGALSASIAHELNQPLGASSLNIQFLKMKLEKGLLNPELAKEILDSLEGDNKRAATIVQSLRSIFIESESGAQDIQLGDLIFKVLDVVKPELKSKNIQIQHQVFNDLLVRVNATEIEQVILNLINNAIQSLANSGTLQRRIAIEAFADAQMVHFVISDNGPGVSEEFKPQLFELLSTTKQTGMGLGLWLSKHIVTRYMGTIKFEDATGGGAKFVVQLPIVR